MRNEARAPWLPAVTRVMATALLSALSLSTARAADSRDIEGMWKIVSPQEMLKPAEGLVPFTAYGKRRYEQNKAYLKERDFDSYDYYTSRCASPGLPRIMLTPQRFRIWQRPHFMLIQFEWNRLARQIDMGGLIRPQRRLETNVPAGGADEALVGRSMPTSKGHWEADTLVVESEGFAGNTLIDNLVPHGNDLKTIERIRLKGSDALEDRIRIEDKEYFTRPWDAVLTYTRQPDEAFPESVCLERIEAERAAAASRRSTP